jgi:CO dehydrogenase maturation factor
MKIAFVGKGGSGKSTVATQMALRLSSMGNRVIAIDADHNMDLSYNLAEGKVSDLVFFGDSLAEISRFAGLRKGEKYPELFLGDRYRKVCFTTDEEDPFFGKYGKKVSKKILLATAGPQTDDVLYGKSCSHVLTTPLKVLLPLLRLDENEVVIVDEKAGADGVSTGIITGVDAGMIVCEPALHSVKTAKQIAELMKFYKTPYIFVGNKVTSSEDKDFIISELGEEPAVFLMESLSAKRSPFVPVVEWGDELEKAFSLAKERSQDDVLERTREKFLRNKEWHDHE